jgi:hypothetical protein
MNWVSVQIHEPRPEDYRPTGRVFVRHVMNGKELFMAPNEAAKDFENRLLGITHWCRIERPTELL